MASGHHELCEYAPLDRRIADLLVAGSGSAVEHYLSSSPDDFCSSSDRLPAFPTPVRSELHAGWHQIGAG